jgi:predicted metal-dependent phosphoesterase TrpH
MKAYKIDLHLHTTASDGSDTPSELIAKAKECGIDILAITDHDTLVGSLEALGIPDPGVKIITGIEFSCHHFGELDFDCHILGYGFDPASPELLAAIAHGREMRLIKLEARLKYLKEHFDIVFPDSDIEWLHSLNSVARPHLGRLLVKYGYVKDMSEAFDRYLKAGGFPDDRIDSKEAITAIKAAGGIPVYAHPIGGEREKRLTRQEVTERIDALIAEGLMGIECYYSRYSELDEAMLLDIALEKGLLVSGGSDYHGENKTVKLGALRSDLVETEADGISVLDGILPR